jgi:hypothetical protein
MKEKVSIFVRNSLKFNQIYYISVWQDIECCATHLESKFSNAQNMF